MSMGEKGRMRELEFSLLLNSTPFLVHISVKVTLILSRGVAEQFIMRGSPAITESLECIMLTVGGEGAVCVWGKRVIS